MGANLPRFCTSNFEAMETSRQHDRGHPRNWMGLRILIPSLLLATLIVDVALRFVPPQRIAFRAREPASLFATAEGWFAPNFCYENDRSYGDLPNLGNLPPRFRQYRREVFTTDEFGYRNPPSGGSNDMPAAIVVGDSFAVGAGVSDWDTLSGQLMTHLSGRRVYNGAGGGAQWKMTHELIQRLHMRDGLVIWEVLERSQLPESVRAETSDFSKIADRIASPTSKTYRTLRALKHWTQSYLAYSPLSIFLTRGFEKVENGVWLPNPLEKVVLVAQLRNGDSMLFLDFDVQTFYRPLHDSGTYLSEISALVHATGNELLVLLVPEKYNVYYPLLSEKGESPPEGESRLDHLEMDLHRSGIPVLNLTSPLRSQAAEGLQRREYNYWIDDTHWNRLGIETATAAILRAWKDHSRSISNDSIRRNTSSAAR
jgi:hypothetical protein